MPRDATPPESDGSPASWPKISGMPSAGVEAIVRAAPLHDLGKIGVPIDPAQAWGS
jgi:hypothetical protein